LNFYPNLVDTTTTGKNSEYSPLLHISKSGWTEPWASRHFPGGLLLENTPVLRSAPPERVSRVIFYLFIYLLFLMDDGDKNAERRRNPEVDLQQLTAKWKVNVPKKESKAGPKKVTKTVSLEDCQFNWFIDPPATPSKITHSSSEGDDSRPESTNFQSYLGQTRSLDIESLFPRQINAPTLPNLGPHLLDYTISPSKSLNEPSQKAEPDETMAKLTSTFFQFGKEKDGGPGGN
jgi:hypothetical protein